MKYSKALWLSALGLFLLAGDQFLKWQALHAWQEPRLAFGGWLGWQLFLNPGIAFGIPCPTWLVVALTVPIVLILGYVAARAIQKNSPRRLLASVLIISGALSNLLDRVQYGVTVDYLRFFTGMINLADICIVLGGVVIAARITRQAD